MKPLDYCLYTDKGWVPLTGGEYPPEDERGMLVKILLLGNRSIGKSTFIGHLDSGTFLSDAPYTIGVDFAQVTLTTSNRHLGNQVMLQVWDDLSCQRYRSATKAFYRHASVFFFCFEHKTAIHPTSSETWAGFPSPDAAVEEAFASIKPWISEFSGPSRPIEFPLLPVVVGMKADLVEACDDNTLLRALCQEPRGAEEARADEHTKSERPEGRGLVLARYFEAFAKLMEQRVKAFIEEELRHSTSFPVRCFHTSSKSGSGVHELLQYVADTMQAYRTNGSSGGDRCRAGAVRLPTRLPKVGAADSTTHSTSKKTLFGLCSVA